MPCYVAGRSHTLGAGKDNVLFTDINNIKHNAQDIIDIACLYNITLYITRYAIYKQDGTKLPIDLTPSITVKKIVGGESHYCILLNNGTLYAFGSNHHGQKGTINPDLYSYNGGSLLSLNITNRKELMDEKDQAHVIIHHDVDDVVCGYYHTVFVRQGEVYGMGRSSEYQLGFPCDVVTGPTKLDVPDYPYKIVAGSHTSIVLYGSGVACATGGKDFKSLGPHNYCGFRVLEPFFSNGFYDKKQRIRNIWCTALCTYVLTFEGKVYICGTICYDGTFDQMTGVVDTFTLSKFLTAHKMQYITGLYSLVAVCEDGVYVCGYNCKQQLDSRRGNIATPIVHEQLSELVVRYPTLNIYSSFVTLSVNTPAVLDYYITCFRRLLQSYPKHDIHIVTFDE